MLEYAFYEALYRNGSGYRCPRCYTCHGYADGFGMSRCHNCGIYFSVISNESTVGTTFRKVIESLRNRIKEMFAKIRGKR